MFTGPGGQIFKANIPINPALNPGAPLGPGANFLPFGMPGKQVGQQPGKPGDPSKPPQFPAPMGQFQQRFLLPTGGLPGLPGGPRGLPMAPIPPNQPMTGGLPPTNNNNNPANPNNKAPPKPPQSGAFGPGALNNMRMPMGPIPTMGPPHPMGAGRGMPFATPPMPGGIGQPMIAMPSQFAWNGRGGGPLPFAPNMMAPQQPQALIAVPTSSGAPKMPGQAQMPFPVNTIPHQLAGNGMPTLIPIPGVPGQGPPPGALPPNNAASPENLAKKEMLEKFKNINKVNFTGKDKGSGSNNTTTTATPTNGSTDAKASRSPTSNAGLNPNAYVFTPTPKTPAVPGDAAKGQQPKTKFKFQSSNSNPAIGLNNNAPSFTPRSRVSGSTGAQAAQEKPAAGKRKGRTETSSDDPPSSNAGSKTRPSKKEEPKPESVDNNPKPRDDVPSIKRDPPSIEVPASTPRNPADVEVLGRTKSATELVPVSEDEPQQGSTEQSPEPTEEAQADEEEAPVEFTLTRLKVTGRQMTRDEAFIYSKPDLVAMMNSRDEYMDLPAEIDDNKVLQREFRQIQGNIAKVGQCIKELVSSDWGAQMRHMPGIPSSARRYPNRPGPGQHRPDSTRGTRRGSVRKTHEDEGFSRTNFGRIKQKPRTPMQQRGPRVKPLPQKSATAYVANVGRDKKQLDSHILVERKSKAYLNKITPDNFDRVANEFLNFLSENIEDYESLKTVVRLMFEKACQERPYAASYAQLCMKLSVSLPEVKEPEKDEAEASSSKKEGDSSEKKKKSTQFRRALLFECQMMFERGTALQDHYKEEVEKNKKEVEKLNEEEQLEMELKAKSKVIGNVMFMGELFKLKLIHERILHRCIQHLLTNTDSDKEPQGGESKNNKIISKMDLEAAVNLLRSTGKELDRPQAKKWVDQYFNYLKHHSKLMGEKRMIFMVEDLEEIRKKRWVLPDTKKKEVGTKAQVKAEFEKKLAEKNKNNRRGPPNSRGGPNSSRRDRKPVSTRRPTSTISGGGSTRTWGNQGASNNRSNSQDVRGNLSTSARQTNRSQNRAQTVVRTNDQHKSRYANLERGESNTNEKTTKEDPIPPKKAKSFDEIWKVVDEAFEIMSQVPDNQEPSQEHNKVYDEALDEVTNSSVDPEEFICKCMEKLFEGKWGNERSREALADFLIILGQARYFSMEQFKKGIFQYVERYEDFISDTPKMVLYTIELIDRCIERKNLVLTIIEGMLKILERPPTDFFYDLPSHLGRALLEFSDGAAGIGERRKLAEELNGQDLTVYFKFKPNPKDKKGEPGSFKAEKFLRNKPKWLQRAGFKVAK